MKRKIIEINEEKCNGCGLCVTACHEGALTMVDGKAKLISESYCDGLGDCLPQCPTDAIIITEREADPFIAPAPGSPADLKLKTQTDHDPVEPGKPGFTCPGTQARLFNQAEVPAVKEPVTQPVSSADPADQNQVQSKLRQWPVQIKLAPVSAPFFNQAHLLIAADCAAYARATFHQDFMNNKITLIGCPKLDQVDYSEKLSQIIARNDLKSITIVRMEVPCCGGLEQAVKQALLQAGELIPWQVITIGTDGSILDN